MLNFRKPEPTEKNHDTINDEAFKFDKKIVKIYKALRVMEKQKHLEPRFSESLKDLAMFLSEIRK